MFSVVLFYTTTLATSFLLWYFCRESLARWWDEGTWTQHKIFVGILNVLVAALFALLFCGLYFEYSNHELPIFFEILFFFLFQSLIIGVLATHNRGKRMKRIIKKQQFRRMMQQKRNPQTTNAEPSLDTFIDDLIKKNK